MKCIFQRMKDLGVTQTELAKRMNASRPYVVKALHGHVNISFEAAARFAHALQMDFVPMLTPHVEEDGDAAVSLQPAVAG